MSVPARDPMMIAGTPRSSGDVQTGEIPWTRGGGRSTSIQSGALAASLSTAPGATGSGTGQYVLYPGPGRLNTIFQHQNVLTLSGVAINFYDAGLMTTSGVGISGTRIIAVINTPGGQSGQFTGTLPLAVDMPFTSGLCVSAPSGAPGFTASFTPESNILDAGGTAGA